MQIRNTPCTSSKDSLAKLLAQEDLAVEHRSIDTAQFNVETRVLSLPIWQTDIKIVDAMIAHEVGHALYTPNDWSFEVAFLCSFVNVVEDIRVEKLMKRRYGGISKTFFKGYSELHGQDFFSIEGKNISGLNLADRLNPSTRLVLLSRFLFLQKNLFLLSVQSSLKVLRTLLNLLRISISSVRMLLRSRRSNSKKYLLRRVLMVNK